MSQTTDNSHPNNALIFSAALSNSFKQIAESVSESTFLEAFSILKAKPTTARTLYKAFVKDLHDNMDAHLKELLAEGTLTDALSKACKLSEDAVVQLDENVWRPPGDVKQHLISLDAEKIREENEKLETQLNELETENEMLMKKVSEERARVRAVNEQMSRILNKSPVAISHVEHTIEYVRDCVELLERE